MAKNNRCRICLKLISNNSEDTIIAGKDEFGLKLIHKIECYNLYLFDLKTWKYYLKGVNNEN